MSKRKLFHGFLIFTLCWMSPLPAVAAFCMEPSEPVCIKYGTGFSGKNDFENCKWEMESYLRKVRDYRQCLKGEIEEIVTKSDEALSKANKTVKTFNCYASGSKYCY